MMTVVAQRALKHAAMRVNRHFGPRTGKTSYFAYGANMDSGILGRLGVIASSSRLAQLPDHRIEMTAPCEYLGKGFASISPDQGSSVWGVLHEIDRAALWVLDCAEWVPFGFYDRSERSVLVDGNTVSAVVYVARHPKAGLRPSRGYRDLLARSAQCAGAPEDYCASLRTLESGEEFPLDHGFRLSNPGRRRIGERLLRNVYAKHDKLREKLCALIP